MKYKGKSDSGVEHLVWEDLLEEMKALHKEFENAFLKNSPLEPTPIRMGHELKINLENNTHLVLGPSTSSTRSFWRKRDSEFLTCSSMDLFEDRIRRLKPQTHSS